MRTLLGVIWIAGGWISTLVLFYAWARLGVRVRWGDRILHGIKRVYRGGGCLRESHRTAWKNMYADIDAFLENPTRANYVRVMKAIDAYEALSSDECCGHYPS